MTWPAVSKPKNGTWDHISGLCQAGLCHIYVFELHAYKRQLTIIASLTTALHCKNSQSWGQLSNKYMKSFGSSTGKNKKWLKPAYLKCVIKWSSQRKKHTKALNENWNLQFPRPPQPLLMMPLCPVISNASTIIWVIFTGSSTGWHQKQKKSGEIKL